MCVPVGIQSLCEVRYRVGGREDQALEYLHFFLSGHFYEDNILQ